MGLVGIVAKTRGRAERVRDALSIDPKNCVLISTVNSARGCKLDAVIWVGHIEDEVIYSVEPAAMDALLEVQAWER